MFGYFAGNTASDSFFYYMIDLFRLFQTRSFVLSSKHQNQNDSCDPQCENLLGEDCICIVNFLEIPQVLFLFFLITCLTSFGCLRREVLFCQASMKIKISPLSVHC